MKNFRKLILFSLAVLFSSCGSSFRISKSVHSLAQKFSHHTGFVLIDPESGKILININGEKYFTPASNTKILTLLAGLTTLGDSIPALRYRVSGDSLIISGAGDPSFLYSGTYSTTRAFEFLKNFQGHIFLTPRKQVAPVYGPGWSWDDFDTNYQPERSEFPLFGNLASFRKTDTDINSTPTLFSDKVSIENQSGFYYRDRDQNQFYLSLKEDQQIQVPFITSGPLIARLLSDTLKRTVGWLPRSTQPGKVIFSVPSDSLYKTMMQVSDNLIAEQLLMMVSDKLSDSLDTKPAIRHLLHTTLSDLPQKPIWVDGSGLSRYNQISPLDLVMIWQKILQYRTKEELIPLLAASGRNGTLNSLNKGVPPFVFGKTGTLSNNYSLSGFLQTQKGHLLIFSSMNANFTVPARKVRDELQQILIDIYEHY